MRVSRDVRMAGAPVSSWSRRLRLAGKRFRPLSDLLVGLAPQPGLERSGVVAFLLLGGELERYGPVLLEQGLQFRVRVLLALEFRRIAPPELGPTRRVMAVPLAQRRARRDVTQPMVHAGLALRQAPRPEAIHQYPAAVGLRGLEVDALELDHRLIASATEIPAAPPSPAVD